MPRRYVLVGTGPAAMSAAEVILALEPDADVTAVGPEPAGYYSRPGLAYYLAREVPERILLPVASAEAARLGLRRVVDRVVSIDPVGRRVTLAGGDALRFHRLLLATGSSAVPLGVEGDDLDGVVKLDDLDDANDLIRRARLARSAVVVGGGITALEIAEGLTRRGVRVHYLMRKDRYWGNVLSEAESRIVEDGLRGCGVQVHTFTEAAAVLGSSGRVVAVETQDGRRISCDLVAVAIGVRPQIDLAESAGLACGRGVQVDGYLRSSAKDVFAAGDIAEVRRAPGEEPTMEVLWNSAIGKGRVAGHNMVSDAPREYVAPPALNVTRLAGFKVTIMGTVGTGADADVKGIVRGDSEMWRRSGGTRLVETSTDGAHVRLSLTERTIAGAVVIGDQELSFPLQELIAGEADVCPIIGELQAPSDSLPEVIQRFHREWKGAHA